MHFIANTPLREPNYYVIPTIFIMYNSTTSAALFNAECTHIMYLYRYYLYIDTIIHIYTACHSIYAYNVNLQLIVNESFS